VVGRLQSFHDAVIIAAEDPQVIAAQTLNVPAGKAIIAYGTGDAWTNPFQPFWAIALLGITGMRPRDMFGYCIVLLFALVPFFAILLTWLPC